MIVLTGGICEYNDIFLISWGFQFSFKSSLTAIIVTATLVTSVMTPPSRESAIMTMLTGGGASHFISTQVVPL